MKIIVTVAVLLLMAGCDVRNESETNVRYVLGSGASGVGVFRLDTIEGHIDWCRPVGTAESGYTV